MTPDESASLTGTPPITATINDGRRMLVELTVRDFALIDRLELSFSPNFNVITGETGAGKSILIGALGSLLGMRTSSEMVRTGSERALVEALFRLPVGHPARVTIEELGGEFDGDDVIVRREMTVDGRTRGWIGGVSVPMKTIREVGDLILDFHGQHDHQFLLNPSGHGELLDAFAGNASEREAVREAHAELQRLRRERKALVDRQTELAAKRDLMEFERKELDEIDPQPDEYEALDAERKVLENVERLGELLNGLSHLLTEAEESVVTQLGAGRRWLSEATEIDDSLQEITTDYEQAEILCQDLSARLADRLGSLEADPMAAGVRDEPAGASADGSCVATDRWRNPSPGARNWRRRWTRKPTSITGSWR